MISKAERDVEVFFAHQNPKINQPRSNQITTLKNHDNDVATKKNQEESDLASIVCCEEHEYVRHGNWVDRK